MRGISTSLISITITKNHLNLTRNFKNSSLTITISSEITSDKKREWRLNSRN